MTGPNETVVAEYSYQRYHNDHASMIGFREVDLGRDLGRLHQWLNQSHVLPYWTQDDPLPKVRDTITERAANEDQTLYIGYLNHVPMSYWETYWAVEDRVARYYDADLADQGIHLLIGPPEYLGHSHAKPLIETMLAFQFQHPETQRVVVEPDVRNEKVIHIFEKCGFKHHKQIQLDDKRAQLMICRRETFESEVSA